MKNSILGIAALAVVLSGCSSLGKKEFVEIEKTESGVDKVPAWYVEPQEDQGTLIFGAGTGLSDDLQFSMDKAMHEAKIVLADKMSSQATSSVKRFVTDNAAGTQSKTVQKTEKVSKTGFKDINVSNYDIVNRSVFKEKSLYRTYVLLQLNTDEVEINTIPITTINVGENAQADEAFSQLEPQPVPNNGQFLPVN